MTSTEPVERGGQAEYCPKCKFNVLPVGYSKRGGKGHWEWHCPNCSTPTEPKT